MLEFSGFSWCAHQKSIGSDYNNANFWILILQMIDDQDLGFFANFLGIFIFVLVIAYHYVMADPKYDAN